MSESEKKARGPGQRKSFGVQETTPTGGVIRKGVRGEGADQRNVEKRLKFTPGNVHRAEYETCDQEDCSSSNPCKQCAKFTKKNIKNARAAKRRPRMDEEELQEKNKKRRQLYNRMDEEERQEKNQKRRELYNRMGKEELQEKNQKRRKQMDKKVLQEKHKKRREKYKP